MNGEAVALFCATFLRPEMLHVYRHISGVKRFLPIVITQKREGHWPADRIEIVRRSSLRFVARAVERISGQPWQISLREARRINQILQEHRAALLHIFFGSTAIHMLPLMRIARAPIVISFHGSDVAGAIASSSYRIVREEMFARARLALCRSEDLVSKVAALGCPVEKLRVMRTVLPSLDFAVRVPPQDGNWRLMQAARLVPKKGIGTSLRAFAKFLEVYPHATLAIAGEGPMREELENLARNLGISTQVRFMGFLSQENLRKLFSESHIFLHPSETFHGDVEGVPNGMLEAMASGLPVVATRHGGISEVIVNGVTGLLTNEKDDVALASALKRLASDENLLQKVAQSGSDFVRSEFSVEKQIANIERLYCEAAQLQ